MENNLFKSKLEKKESIKLFVKLGAKTVERFFSLADNTFIEDVNDDINNFITKNDCGSVLVFPPLSNYRRFLIHKCVSEFPTVKLSTFSVGVGDERRTIVCYPDKLLSDVACAKPTMGLSHTERDDSFTRTDTECKTQRKSRENTRSVSTKPRRPDRAVYVPRALRSSDQTNTEEHKPPDTRKRTSQSVTANSVSPKSPRDKSLPNTPKKGLDKKYCNVYTPPHLRNQTSQPIPDDDAKTNEENTVPNSEYTIEYSDKDIGNNFYIGDYFANGQLGLYNPSYYEDYSNNFSDNTSTDADADMNMASETHRNIIQDEYKKFKDEDAEKNELRRASEEINRSSKRIIKQSFHSDVLVISDPIEEPVNEIIAPVIEEKKEQIEVPKPKPKLEPKVSLKREENDWESVFDDSGECLDPSLLEELTATVGKVQISKAKNSYDQYQTRGQVLFSGPYDEAFGHVVEVYDFPNEFKTNDLLSVFSDYKDTGFEIKWVDDTHALICFSSSKIAADVLSSQWPMVRCRPLHAATSESRNKAKKCAEFLQPYRQRPETCTALARRLVSGALGVRLSTARQERDEERRLISKAKEKKRQAALHKEAAWDGSLGTKPVGDS